MEQKTNHATVEEASLQPKLAIKIFFISKITEVVLAIFCIGLIVDPYRHMRETDVTHAALTYVAYCGSLISNTIFLLGLLAREEPPLKVILMFTFVNGVLLIAAGGVVISDWARFRNRVVLLQPKQYMDMMIASAVIAIFNGVAHFIDLVVTIMYW